MVLIVGIAYAVTPRNPAQLRQEFLPCGFAIIFSTTHWGCRVFSNFMGRILLSKLIQAFIYAVWSALFLWVIGQLLYCGVIEDATHDNRKRTLACGTVTICAGFLLNYRMYDPLFMASSI